MSLVTWGPFESEPEIGNLSVAHTREAVEVQGGAMFVSGACFPGRERSVWKVLFSDLRSVFGDGHWSAYFSPDAEVSCWKCKEAWAVSGACKRVGRGGGWLPSDVQGYQGLHVLGLCKEWMKTQSSSSRVAKCFRRFDQKFYINCRKLGSPDRFFFTYDTSMGILTFVWDWTVCKWCNVLSVQKMQMM